MVILVTVMERRIYASESDNLTYAGTLNQKLTAKDTGQEIAAHADANTSTNPSELKKLESLANSLASLTNQVEGLQTSSTQAERDKNVGLPGSRVGALPTQHDTQRGSQNPATSGNYVLSDTETAGALSLLGTLSLSDANQQALIQELDKRLANLSTRINSINPTSYSASYATPSSNFYEFALSNKIDQLASLDISNSTISDTNISGGSISGASVSGLTSSGNQNFGNTLYVDAENGRVGIGTSSPTRPLELHTDNGPEIKVKCQILTRPINLTRLYFDLDLDRILRTL